MSHPKPIVCAISAYDSSGHAGHSCDLRTITDLGGHGTGIITALTAQNSLQVLDISATAIPSLQHQCQALTQDCAPSAIKVGLICGGEHIQVLQHFLATQRCPVILDPVFSASSGTHFVSDHEIAQYQQLFAHTTLLTPNLPEAEKLLGYPLQTRHDITAAATQLRAMGANAVLMKGGHGDWSGPWVMDYFDDGTRRFWLRHLRQATPHRRGTGCTLASAIATFCAGGKALVDAVVLASAYVQQGLRTGFAIGTGNGLLGNGGWPRHWPDYPHVQETALRAPKSPFPTCGPAPLGIYPLVESLEWLERMLRCGVTTVQLRLKNRDHAELERLIHGAVLLGKRFNARVFINDHWQLAIQYGAYGVHLGQEDLCDDAVNALHQAGLRLGISSHSEYEWLRAAALQPSYIAMGAVFGTSTKTGVVTIGLNNLQQWAALLAPQIPLVAIGGITPDNLASVAATGVNGIAVVSAVQSSNDPERVLERLQQLFNTHSAHFENSEPITTPLRQ